MQLSAANLLIASQQLARVSPSRDARAQFSAALAKEGVAPSSDAFAPLAFKQTAASTKPVSEVAPAPSRMNQLGANIDIRV